MLVKKLSDCKEITAGDNCFLREILSGRNDGLDIGYSIAWAYVKPGETTYRHKLKTSSEIYFIIKGKGIMRIEDEKREVGPEDTVYIPPDSVQCITNTGDSDLVFICIVQPSWKKEDEIVTGISP